MAFIFHNQIPNNSLSLAVLAGIAEAALVSLREQGRNLLGIKMIIFYYFSNFDLILIRQSYRLPSLSDAIWSMGILLIRAFI